MGFMRFANHCIVLIYIYPTFLELGFYDSVIFSFEFSYSSTQRSFIIICCISLLQMKYLFFVFWFYEMPVMRFALGSTGAITLTAPKNLLSSFVWTHVFYLLFSSFQNTVFLFVFLFFFKHHGVRRFIRTPGEVRDCIISTTLNSVVGGNW